MDINETIAKYFATILRVKDFALVLELLRWWNKEYADLIASIINYKSLALFGALMRLVCMRAGISQTRLGIESKEYIKAFKARGWMKRQERSDVSQSALSDACQGKLEPSYTQLRIWLYAIRRVYEDPQFRQKCELKKRPFYEFPIELEKDIWYLARKGYDDDMLAAYLRRKNMIIELPYEEWWNGLEPDLPEEEDDIDETDPRLPVIRRYVVSDDDSPRKAVSYIES